MADTVKVEFEGHDGSRLDARLDTPAGRPRGYALFTHCFSCSKDLLVASRLARRLVSHGFAVLRFDFTGLGHSEGDFSNTNFSSNVDDLIAAANWLTQTHGRCDLLIGHSLGGAAAIVAGTRLPQVRAVVTLGAPARADHVLRQLSPKLDEIDATGEANVILLGREFTIRKQFVNDVSEARVTDAAERLKRPLMIMHAPLDEIVGIDNATELFMAAKHPKSFVSLDHADHLLSNKVDTDFAADTIAAWASRYIPEDVRPMPDQTVPRGKVRVSETGEGGYANFVQTGHHILRTDEPTDLGGHDTGPTPVEFLSAALAACTSITLRMYLDRKGWQADHISVDVSFSRAEEKDENGWNQVTFTRELNVEGPLTEDQRNRLGEIADKCPVHRILSHRSDIVTILR